MGYHEYIGNNNHNFNHSDECKWCRDHIKRGHKINFTPTNRNNQGVITPFCSPKCYYESIEKGNTEKNYYESVVSKFIEDGGIEKWEKNLENFQQRVKDSEEKFRKKKEENPFYWVDSQVILVLFLCIAGCSGLIWLLMKFL